MSLRTKAVKSFSWNLLEGVAGQGVTFIVGIFLARILTPFDFGLIGLTTVLIAICNSIVGSGFGSALIRKTDATEEDYGTIFFSNVFISILLYVVLYFCSGFVSEYLEEPSMQNIIKVSSLVLLINAFILVQKTILVKKLDFKTQAIISVIASLISGILGVVMAYNGYGVWSLVYMTLLKQFFYCFGIWLDSDWYPKFIFSKKSFNELFGYSYKLLLSELINTIYGNIYYFIIGKVYSPVSLGFYTRADGFLRPFSSNISLGIKRISFPIFSELQNDTVQLKSKFRKFIRINMMISSIVMFFLIPAAKPIIYILVGSKWHTSVLFMQILSVPGLIYGLQILNLNLLMVKGFSDLNLKLELIKKLILIPLILISSLFEIKFLLYGFVLFSIVEFFINSYYTNKLINYSITEQLKDISGFLAIGLVSVFILFSVLLLDDLSIQKQLIIQIVLYLFYYFIIVKYSNVAEFKELHGFVNRFFNTKLKTRDGR